jgi:DNA invertase Pin-like site-specific DNA recombinase
VGGLLRHRTELQRLLNYCRTQKGKVHFVVVYNLTRFAREKYDHFALRALLKLLGISLRSATNPSTTRRPAS